MKPRSNTGRRAAMVLTLCVIAGLLLPRMGAALAEVAGFDAAVICRGDSLAILHLAPDGTPVETELADHGPCAIPDLARAAVSAVPVWHRLVAVVRPAPIPGIVPLPGRWHGPPPMRAPPPSA